MAIRSWKGNKIVIVDDSKRIRDDLRAKFNEIELNVVAEAANGIEALQLIEAYSPDLVSLDIIMPEMNGFEVSDRVKEVYPGIRCFFVSCLASEPKVKESCQSKYDIESFFPKPLDLRSFEDWLNKNIVPIPMSKFKIAS
jgi:YesN/AraC family two-component response regulator